MSNTPNSDSSRTAGVLAPPPFILLGALAGGLIIQIVTPRPLFTHPTLGRVIGALLILLGLALSIAVVHFFRQVGTPVSPGQPSHHLVVTGLYRFSRNPDYLGQMLLYGGIALLVNSQWVLLTLLPAFLLIRCGVIAREEKYLEDLFGEEYRRYRQRVRRWL
ncbi:MAG: isoprenylcysteine carboxylmethyltransferase family protein [Chloroflexi bacterium]|nr:isoprenylcysteine carboxylmethyltransferase family protein [Chloroflexota bacterium]